MKFDDFMRQITLTKTNVMGDNHNLSDTIVSIQIDTDCDASIVFDNFDIKYDNYGFVCGFVIHAYGCDATVSLSVGVLEEGVNI